MNTDDRNTLPIPAPHATVQDRLREWARGAYATEAGAELLIRGTTTVYDGAPWIIEGNHAAAVDVAVLLDESGPWSSGERKVIAIAASLLDGPPVALEDVVTSLDRRHMALVLAALSHAAGSHEDHDSLGFDDQGRPYLLPDPVQLPALYPWP